MAFAAQDLNTFSTAPSYFRKAFFIEAILPSGLCSPGPWGRFINCKASEVFQLSLV